MARCSIHNWESNTADTDCPTCRIGRAAAEAISLEAVVIQMGGGGSVTARLLSELAELRRCKRAWEWLKEHKGDITYGCDGHKDDWAVCTEPTYENHVVADTPLAAVERAMEEK